jgi:hypothetical protein
MKKPLLFPFQYRLVDELQLFKRMLSVLILIFLIQIKIQAQVPSPACGTTLTGTETTIPSGQVYCVTSDLTMSSSSLQINGTLVVKTGHSLKLTGSFLSQGGTVFVEDGATITVVGSTTLNPGSITYIGNYSAFETCGSTFSGFVSPIFTYNGTGNPAVVRQNLQVTGLGTNPMKDSPNILWMAETFFVANVGGTPDCAPGSTTCGAFSSIPSCGNFFGYSFAPAATCNAGTTAPTLSATTKSNVCPATTADVSSLVSSSCPSGSTLQWHNVSTGFSASTIVTASSVTAGTYFPVCFDATNTCYSPAPATGVTVTINTCSGGSTLCTGTADQGSLFLSVSSATGGAGVYRLSNIATSPSLAGTPEVSYGGNTITGLAVTNHLNGGSGYTFYGSNLSQSPAEYAYSTGGAWTNTGHTAPYANHGGATNAIYSLSNSAFPITQTILKYTGAGAATSIATFSSPVTQFIQDIAVDVNGKFYVLKGSSLNTLQEYDANGTALTAYTVTGLPNTNSYLGFVMLNDALYAFSTTSNIIYKGTLSGSTVNFSTFYTVPAGYTVDDLAGCPNAAGTLISTVVCNAGTTAPTLSATTKSNVCPATTADVSSLVSSSCPSGSTLQWHNVSTGFSASTIVTASSIGAGTYYPVCFDATNTCYSPAPATGVTVTINTCVTCNAGTTAPTLSATTKSNVCPATTADVSSLVSSSCPSGSTLQWHNVSTGFSASTIVTASSVTAGTYFPVCFDATNTCYSPAPATGVTVTISVCCASGTNAPVLSATTQTNVCPATTANLSSLVTSTCPLGSTLEWHNVATGFSTSSKVTTPTGVAAGTYYPVCFDVTNTCYSPAPATGVTVTINTCNTVSCSGTTIGSATIAPTTGTVANTYVVNSQFSIQSLSAGGGYTDASTGYRFGTPTATTDRNYKLIFSSPVTNVVLHLGFINNDIALNSPNPAGEETIANITAVGASGAVYTFQDFSTSGMQNLWNPTTRTISSTINSFGPNSNSKLQISSTTPFTEITLTYDYITGTNPFGVILEDVCYELACKAGTTAPTLSATTKSNVCPATTADISSLVSSTCPVGSSLEWHTVSTGFSAANKVANPATVAAGTYYPVCHDATNTCYSPAPATGVTVTITSPCPVDSDSDGILDSVDLDDDNDGILDTVERCPAATTGTWTISPGSYTYTDATNDLMVKVTLTNFSSFWGGTVPSNNAMDASCSPLFTTYSASAINTANSLQLSTGNVSGGATSGNFKVEYFNAAGTTPKTVLNPRLHVGRLGGTYNSGGGVYKVNSSSWSLLGGKTMTKLSGNSAFGVTSTKMENADIGVIKTINGECSAGMGGGTIMINGAVNSFEYAVTNLDGAGNPTNNTLYFDGIRVILEQDLPCSDTDEDGIVNSLDLDSDDDGCSDAFEAGATTSLAANYTFPAPYGTNGLANAKETVVDNGIVNYTATYANATNDAIKNCIDTDGDGITDATDLDDDNDGILDVTELPTCQRYSPNSATTTATNFEPGRELALTYDNDLNTFGGTDVFVGTLNGSVTYSYNTPLSNVDEFVFYSNGGVIISDGQVTTIGSIEVFDINDNIIYSQSNISIPQASTLTPFVLTFPSALNNVKKFRLSGLTDASGREAIWKEVYLKGCLSVDLDNDGIFNSLDLDSDGDGCSDAIEGGASFTSANLVTSSIPGGNSGVGYTGTSANPVTQNLGNTVNTTSSSPSYGVPTIATTGQTIGTSQNGAVKDPACCASGTTAPTLSATTQSNVCPATTADISSLVSSSCPSGSSLEWHTVSTGFSAANKVANPASVAAGTYYPVCFDVTNTCYSPAPATGVTVTITTCTSPLTISQPPAIIKPVNTAVTGTTPTDVIPTGGTGTITYSNGSTDPLCVAPSGANPLPGSSNLLINSMSGGYSYTTPTTAGTYYFCVKVCDSTPSTPVCKIAIYKVTVTAPSCAVGTAIPTLK